MVNVGPRQVVFDLVEIVLVGLVIWFVWRIMSNSAKASKAERVRQVCSRMREVLSAERKWDERGWWHSDRFNVAQMVYSHGRGIDDQAWFSDYLAVRIGTGDWWLRERATSHHVGAEETADGPQDHWFPAKRMMHDPQPFLDAVYMACVEFFRSTPGFTPLTGTVDPLVEPTSTHVWTPPVHAEHNRVEQSWAEFQIRAEALQEYESTAMDASERCGDCGVPNTVSGGQCNRCGKVLAKMCSCGFTNLAMEVVCKSCGRRLQTSAS
jgi:hypothetical protein